MNKGILRPRRGLKCWRRNRIGCGRYSVFGFQEEAILIIPDGVLAKFIYLCKVKRFLCLIHCRLIIYVE